MATITDNIRLCFHHLSLAVKLKLLLWTLHHPSCTADEMKDGLMVIVQLATLHSYPWVLMVADILKSFPDKRSFNLDLEEQNPNVQDTLGELRGKRRRGAEVVEKPAKEETLVENTTPGYTAGLVSTQKLRFLNSEPELPSTSYLPFTPSMVPASSYVLSSEAPPAPTSWETSLQATRLPEEPSTLSPTLPAQFKQRAPMYNSSLSPAVPTPVAPTLPLTPTTPPAVTSVPQMPLVAIVVPQTQPPAQQKHKKLPFMRTHARSKGT
ncbi:Negative elongation factor A [Sciurus carolinensis]|uniref:Negative elongation factor A n=1 Tax=Sciurus carolinensis TaxID=30640 RepID=A0AA41ME45_SCICA|nr:Negative elongation factor A [Sciurus carolinensis]